MVPPFSSLNYSRCWQFDKAFQPLCDHFYKKIVKEIFQVGVTWGLITIFCTESWLISYILRIQWVPPWHPWAKLIIQDGVRDGWQNIIAIMFQKISASNNPRHMIIKSKHNVIGVESSIDDISEHLRSKMAAIIKMAAVLAIESCCSP